MDWKEEYFKIFNATEFDVKQIELAQSIKAENMPKKLFKYRPINDNSLDNLENDTVWVNSPSEYNDPYEFYEKHDIDILFKAIEKKHFNDLIHLFQKEFNLPLEIIEDFRFKEEPIISITKYILETATSHSKSEIESIVNSLDSISKKMVGEKNKEKILFIQNSMKVSSFCESNEVLLMWSHYANSHKGICIEYDLTKWQRNDSRLRLLYPVIYTNEIYDATKHLENYILNADFNALYPNLSGTTKSTIWQYENEWRFIFQIGPSWQSQNFLMNCQSSVYLGKKIGSVDREKVIDICERKNINVHETTLDEQNQKLIFKEIRKKHSS